PFESTASLESGEGNPTTSVTPLATTGKPVTSQLRAMVNYLRRDVETAAASVRETAEEPRTDRPRYQVSISRSPNSRTVPRSHIDVRPAASRERRRTAGPAPGCPADAPARPAAGPAAAGALRHARGRFGEASSTI